MNNKYITRGGFNPSNVRVEYKGEEYLIGEGIMLEIIEKLMEEDVEIRQIITQKVSKFIEE